MGSRFAIGDDLVLHYQGVNRLLGSPERLNVAIAVTAAFTVLAGVAAVIVREPVTDNFAVWVGAIAGLSLVMFVYARLRFANAGLFLSGGRIGVIGTLGGRSGLEVSQVDHLQLGRLVSNRGTGYGVLLFIDRSGAALLRLNVAELIPEDGLQELSRRSGIPIQGSLQETYTIQEMRRRFPRSLSRATTFGDTVSRHPLLARGVVFVVVVVVVLVVYALTR